MDIVSSKKIYKIINDIISYNNDYLIGFSDVESFLDKRYTGYKSAITIAKKLDDSVINKIVNGPTKEYLELYINTNDNLSSVCDKTTLQLKEIGINALTIKPTVTEKELNDNEDYKKNLKYYFSHKLGATRSGLGWIGKTDLFISIKFGPRVRLSTILIDKNFDIYGEPIEKSRCGDCVICVDKCPAKTSNGKLWDIFTNRDDFYNAHNCKAMCKKISKKKLNKDISICGICIAICPIGQKRKKDLSLT